MSVDCENGHGQCDKCTNDMYPSSSMCGTYGESRLHGKRKTYLIMTTSGKFNVSRP